MKTDGWGTGVFGGRRSSKHYCAGFTIIETMIVLAVTGGLFVIIATTLSGRQNEAEFQHAAQTVQANIQQTIDQVANGFYPNNSQFNCSDSGGTVTFGPGGNLQGTNAQNINSGCVFLGKALQFRVAGSSPETYETYTVAGLLGAVGGANSPFAPSAPAIIGWAGNYANYATATSLEYGLSTVYVRSDRNSTCTSSICSIGAFAVLMEPGSLNASSLSGFNSGKQQIDLVPLRNTTLNQSIPNGVNSIQNNLKLATLTSTAPINPASGVQVCLLSSTTSQSALITVGGFGRQLGVKMDIKNTGNCT